jgi:hypothetical protein
VCEDCSIDDFLFLEEIFPWQKKEKKLVNLLFLSSWLFLWLAIGKKKKSPWFSIL